MDGMVTVWRIQPAGLPVVGHRSEDSVGDHRSLHVFASEVELFGTDVGAQRYGDEVVELRVPGTWCNGDVEGVACDPDAALVVRRWTFGAWVDAVAPGWRDLVEEVRGAGACPLVGRVDGQSVDGWLVGAP